MLCKQQSPAIEITVCHRKAAAWPWEPQAKSGASFICRNLVYLTDICLVKSEQLCGTPGPCRTHNTNLAQPLSKRQTTKKVGFYKTRVCIPFKRNLLETNYLVHTQESVKCSLHTGHPISHPTHVSAGQSPGFGTTHIAVPAGGRTQHHGQSKSQMKLQS